MGLFCKNCNRQLDEEFVFCPYCGIRQEQEQNSFCIRCGAKLPVGAAFCGCCGMPVQGGPVATPDYQGNQGGNVAQQQINRNTQAYAQQTSSFAGAVPPEETVLAISHCQFAKGAGMIASRGNIAITNYRMIYYKHGTLKTLMLGHAVHLTQGEYEMEIPFNIVCDMYWGVQGMSKFLDVRMVTGEHHRIYFIDFDKCLRILQDTLGREIPKR